MDNEEVVRDKMLVDEIVRKTIEEDEKLALSFASFLYTELLQFHEGCIYRRLSSLYSSVSRGGKLGNVPPGIFASECHPPNNNITPLV